MTVAVVLRIKVADRAWVMLFLSSLRRRVLAAKLHLKSLQRRPVMQGTHASPLAISMNVYLR